jgi:uncharacterized protein (DUF362 family)
MSRQISRRDFLVKGSAAIGYATLSSLMGSCAPQKITLSGKPVVSIVKIKRGKIDVAVEEAIDLLEGIEAVTEGKDRIMLKPNLVAESPDFTTKPEVIKTLARLMKEAGKEVLIGEGSAAVGGFNARGGEVYRTSNRDILDRMQQFVFDELGYTELAKSLEIPLINLHSGEMIDVPVPDGLAFDKITLHHTLSEIDLLCSVPMMKTHTLATVTLGMKNLIGLYPGTAYCSVRACVHDLAADAGSPGIAFETIDMVKANKLGLVVVDGSMAMEGDGPTEGDLVRMDVIIAGTNPLATDLVAANVMGFEANEVPTFVWANKAGLGPRSLDEVEIRGVGLDDVKRRFGRPTLYSWNSIRDHWGVREMP